MKISYKDIMRMSLNDVLVTLQRHVVEQQHLNFRYHPSEDDTAIVLFARLCCHMNYLSDDEMQNAICRLSKEPS